MRSDFVYHITDGVEYLINSFYNSLNNNYNLLKKNKSIEIVYKDFLKVSVQIYVPFKEPTSFISVTLLDNSRLPYLRVDKLSIQLLDKGYLDEKIEMEKDSLPIEKWEELLYSDLETTEDKLILELCKFIGISKSQLDEVNRLPAYRKMFTHINHQLKYLKKTYPYDYNNKYPYDEVISLPSLRLFSSGYMEWDSFNKKVGGMKTVGVELYELNVIDIVTSISNQHSLYYLLENVDGILKKYEDKIKPKTKEIDL